MARFKLKAPDTCHCVWGVGVLCTGGGRWGVGVPGEGSA